jgi:hypothetical protein
MHIRKGKKKIVTTPYISQSSSAQHKTPKLSYESDDSSNIYSEESFNNTHIRKGKKKIVTTPYTSQSSSTQHNSLDWVHMAGLLERIENRLNKLEEKDIRIIQSELKAHNRS